MKLSSVLGMNSRNIDYIYNYNDRRLFHLVDDKLETKELLKQSKLTNSKTNWVC